MPRLELPALWVDDVSAERAADRLVIGNRDPAPEEQDVPLETAIALEIVDVGPDGVDPGRTHVWVDGVEALAAGVAQPGFDGPRASVVALTDTLRVVLDPRAPFASEARVEVRVVAETRGGAHRLEVVYAFTCEDRVAPRLVAAVALAPRAVRLGFDERVVVDDPLGFTFEASSAPAMLVVPLGARAEGSTVVVELDVEMTPDAAYQVLARGVTDLAGNPVAPPFDRASFVGYRPRRPARRRFDLWRMLPKHNRRQDTTGDLQRFIACLQEVTDLLLADIDRFAELYDIERAPESFVDLILRDLGNPFTFELDLGAKRRLAASLVDMYRLKGTAPGIVNTVRFFLGVEITALTAFASETLVLGESELGVDWVLGPSDRFARYAFEVHVDRVLSDVERRHLRVIVQYLKPAHTHFVALVEPSVPAIVDHWVLGVSELGESTDLH
ncbi:MAG: hypothetical protein RLO52_30210 [Sandaracinaceae bacterium]